MTRDKSSTLLLIGECLLPIRTVLVLFSVTSRKGFSLNEPKANIFARKYKSKPIFSNSSVRAAAVPYLLVELRAPVLAEGGHCGVADAEVRDRVAAGADSEAPRVGGGCGAAAGSGAGEEPAG
ncbi:hypothetical protein RJ640_028387 [Escallonia rubra]|uniref:Uncharacterized protein n=1 Tax=Escallonia rubra TaxID=112253 RepID=A0AA88QLA3_9ASTE|nr:hypothetical protein RJ640_028387 [Escallonia rubra]